MTGWYEVLASGSGNHGFKFVLRQRQNAQLLSLNPALVSASNRGKLKVAKERDGLRLSYSVLSFIPLFSTLQKISVDFWVKCLETSCRSISRFFVFFNRAPVNIFRNQAQYGSKKICIVFGHLALKPYKGIFKCCQLT